MASIGTGQVEAAIPFLFVFETVSENKNIGLAPENGVVRDIGFARGQCFKIELANGIHEFGQRIETHMPGM